jgi:hypothetical protein
MKNLFERIKRNKKKSLFLALIMFLALALPVTGYFVTSEYGFDDRSQASGNPFNQGSSHFTTQQQQYSGTSGTKSTTTTTPPPGGAAAAMQQMVDNFNKNSNNNKDNKKKTTKKDPYTGRTDNLGPGGQPNPWYGDTKATAPSTPTSTPVGPNDWYATRSGDPKSTTGNNTGSGVTTGSVTPSTTTSTSGGGTTSTTTSSSGNWFTNMFSGGSSGGGGGTTTPPPTSPTDPKCGTHHEQLFAAMQRVWPAGSFCAKGTADPANPVFPAEGNIVTWNCIEGSKSVSCTSGRDFLTRCATTADCSQEAPYEICFNDVCLRGDVLNNGVISMSDFAEFRKDFASFKRNGWADALMRSDFNMDGRISMADFSIFVSSYRLVNGLD